MIPGSVEKHHRIGQVVDRFLADFRIVRWSVLALPFQPQKGTIVLWPATFTHVHRGSFLTGDRAKYIATGWFSREPGQVTNRVIGEKMGKYTPTAREEFKGPPSMA